MTADYKTARALAQLLHRGQVDKGGKPYFEHVERVAKGLMGHQVKTVAYLHDVLEDTPLTRDDLINFGFLPGVIAAVEAVTRKDDELYSEFIDRVVEFGGLALRVKRADVLDHLKNPNKEIPPSLTARYEKAWEKLKTEETI